MKIANETPENIDELFQYCFLLIGLKEKNFPNELEGMFLHQFIRENYGAHSVAEIKIAFNKAVKGELSLKPEEVKCYENFSVLYLSSIINAYRLWAGDAYRQLEKHIPPTESELKRLEAPQEQPHWGYLIEQAYQHFLSFGEEGWKMYPGGFYDQLVRDEQIDGQLFRKAMPIVRKGLVSQLQSEKNRLSIRRFSADADENSTEARAKQINQTKMLDVDKQIAEYMSGEKDGELEVVAKQYCVLQFFKNSKSNLKQNVYVAAE